MNAPDAAPYVVDGELTIYRVAELRDAWQGWLERVAPPGPPCLDLSGVTEIDGAGVQLLLSLARSAHARGAPLQLLAPSLPVREAIDLLGLTQALPCTATSF